MMISKGKVGTRWTARRAAVLAVVLVLAVGAAALAWTRRLSPAVPSPPSIELTMAQVIDPAADALWESVGTVEAAGGETVRAPRTDAEWKQAQDHAEALIAGTRVLHRPDLIVGGVGHGLADASTPGIRTPRQIGEDIARDPTRFHAAADRLRTAGEQARAAILARDPQRLIAAGAAMDAACEACHAAYWYPRTKPLALPPPDQFGKIATNPSTGDVQ